MNAEVSEDMLLLHVRAWQRLAAQLAATVIAWGGRLRLLALQCQ